MDISMSTGRQVKDNFVTIDFLKRVVNLNSKRRRNTNGNSLQDAGSTTKDEKVLSQLEKNAVNSLVNSKTEIRKRHRGNYDYSDEAEADIGPKVNSKKRRKTSDTGGETRFTSRRQSRCKTVPSRLENSAALGGFLVYLQKEKRKHRKENKDDGDCGEADRKSNRKKNKEHTAGEKPFKCDWEGCDY